MPKPKTSGKQKKNDAAKQSSQVNLTPFKLIGAIVLQLLIVVIIGFVVRELITPQHLASQKKSVSAPNENLPPSSSKSVPKNQKKPIVYKVPPFEIYPAEKHGENHNHSKTNGKKTVSTIPEVAIIIDDIGYDRRMAQKFLKLDLQITFSVLPFSRFGTEIANKAKSVGREIMLHLPMEPLEYPEINPGPGVLLTSMSPDKLISQLEMDIEAVPFIKGVNNHMGSKMTSVSTQMRQIFTILKKKHLYFIDSRTTIKTICEPSARLLKIPFAQRDVFLDHDQSEDSIRFQISRLIKRAKQRGHAIGIGHPHDTTYQILKEMLPVIQKQVKIVPASDLVHVTT